MIRPTSTTDLYGLLRLDLAPRRTRPTGRFDGAQTLLLSRSLTDLTGRLATVKETLERLQSREQGRVSPQRGLSAHARVGSLLDLEATERPTLLRSAGEINTIATSYTPFGPVVSGSTTSLPTIGGIYAGDQGDDTLTFEFRQNRAVGSSQRLNVRVYDGTGKRIDTLRFQGSAPDTPVALSNGLTLSLGTGSVTSRDTFSVQVFQTVGSQVDPSKPFNGTRNDQPNFEPGTSVVAGSFEINGAVIAVATDDSIDSVLARINASSAGVSATFDAAAERVVLTHDTPGPNTDIVLANDTSNFLTATRLAGATPVPGEDTTLANNAIGSVPAFAGVADGAFSVNGVAITVDTAVDSLENVIARINASAAGAHATLDPETSLLSIRSRSRTAALELDDGATGFFTAVGIDPRRYQPDRRTQPGGLGFLQPPKVEKDLRDLRRALAGLLSPADGQISEFGIARDRLRDAVSASFESVLKLDPRPILRSGFGLDFDFTKTHDVIELDSDRFAAASTQAFDDLRDFLFLEDEDSGARGLVPSLLAEADYLARLVERRLDQLDPKGRIVDLRA